MKLIEIQKESIPNTVNGYKNGKVKEVVYRFDHSEETAIEVQSDLNEYASIKSLYSTVYRAVTRSMKEGSFINKIRVIMRKGKVYLVKD